MIPMPLCQLQDRALLRLSGPDTRNLLQGLLTQDVEVLAESRPLYAGLLSPQGKTLFQLFLFADGADVLLDVATADRAALEQNLIRFRLRKKVEIKAEDGLAMFQQWDEPSSPCPADPRTPLAGQRFPAPPGEVVSSFAPPGGAVSSLAPPGGAVLSSFAAWQQQRLSLGLPAADEIGHADLLWLETNARELNGVSFAKGCYTGQENTARMHHKDRLRKRLLPLRLPASTDTAADDADAETRVMAGEVEAGRLRGRRHDDLQMALLRVERLDQPLTVAGAAVTLLRPPWLDMHA